MFLISSAVVFDQSIEARCQVEDEDVVGAAPTGVAPTTSDLYFAVYHPQHIHTQPTWTPDTLDLHWLNAAHR